MFGRTPKNVVKKLDNVMDIILHEMDTYGPDSPEYPELLKHLKEVVAMHPAKERARIDINTVLTVVGNVAVALTIVIYEQRHVFTSKAQDYIRKPR